MELGAMDAITIRVRNPSLYRLMSVVLFLFLLGGMVWLPTSLFAAEKTIGVIIPDIPYYRDIHNAFIAKLNREGYGARVEIITQRPFPDPISLSNAARKLIALDADVIIAYGTPSALAVYGEKTKIPIVFAAVYDPFASKIRARNVTGVSSKISITSLLRYLKGITSVSTLGVIYSSNEEDSLSQMRELQKLSVQYGFTVEEINLKRPQDAKMLLSKKKCDAFFITSSSIAMMASPTIMEFSREYRIPTASMIPDRTSYALITLSSNPKEQGERVAAMVIKVLEGTPPERIKVDASSDIELVFNLKDARTMGFRIPMDLITEATKLIQ
jgi:putative ABC transport system substrate-binding protein